MKNDTLHVSLANQAQQGYDMTIAASIRDIEQATWNALNIHNKVPLSYEYLQAFEAAPPEGMKFRYGVFYDQGIPCGIAIFQFVKIGRKVFSKTLPNRQSHHVNRGFYLLMCGNSSISGEYGFSFLPGIDRETAYASLSEAIKTVRKSAGLTTHVVGSIIKDILRANTEDDSKPNGYYAMPFLPNMIVPDVDRWDSFDAYLKAMKGKYRRRTKSVLKKGANVVRKSLSHQEIAENRDLIYQLYLQVHTRSNFRIITLNPRIFEAWRQALGETFVLDAYYCDETMIGFTTRFMGETILEGYTHGVDYACNKDYELYQNMLLDDIKVGIEHRVKTISYGRTSVAMKSSVGAVPQEMALYAKSHIPVPGSLKTWLLQKMQPQKEHCRDPFGEPALS